MKKGISPLIATVLVIGFTIVLAAVIMQWGGSFVRGLTEKQAVQTELQTQCIDLTFEITHVKLNETDGNWTFDVISQVNKEIAGFIPRVLMDGEVISATLDPQELSGISPLGGKKYSLIQTSPEIEEGATYQISLLPEIMINNQKMTCPVTVAITSGEAEIVE